MKEPATIAEMADHYYLLEDDLRLAILLAAGLPRLPKKKTTKDQLRELKVLRKCRPDDDDLWAQEFALQAGQRTVTFNVETREITVAPNDTHKKNSKRTKSHLNAAIAALMDVWTRNHGRGKSPNGDTMLAFITHALRLAGDADVPKPEALRRRISRIRQK